MIVVVKMLGWEVGDLVTFLNFYIDFITSFRLFNLSLLQFQICKMRKIILFLPVLTKLFKTGGFT